MCYNMAIFRGTKSKGEKVQRKDANKNTQDAIATPVITGYGLLVGSSQPSSFASLRRFFRLVPV